jgi:hypothetical protein
LVDLSLADGDWHGVVLDSHVLAVRAVAGDHIDVRGDNHAAQGAHGVIVGQRNVDVAAREAGLAAIGTVVQVDVIDGHGRTEVDLPPLSVGGAGRVRARVARKKPAVAIAIDSSRCNAISTR